MDKITEENFLEKFDQMSALEAFHLAHYIMWCYEEESVTFDPYLLEKPWKYPEIIVPAMNGELDDKVSEIIAKSMEEAF